MSDKYQQAIEQEELRKVLSQTAYSYFGEKMGKDKVFDRITDLNNNSDTPLDNDELVELVDKAQADKKAKSNTNTDNSIYTSYVETTDYILEQISSSPRSPLSPLTSITGSPSFIKYSKSDDTWEEVSEFSYEDRVYKPITDDVFSKGGVKLPSGVSLYTNTAEIINEIKEFIHESCELPTLYENLFPYLALFYWVYEKFPFIPYVQFVGGTGTGKTTAMEAFGALCYKAIDTTGSMTISSVFRMATNWKGTMLIDEFDSMGEHSRDMVSFLKSGVSDRLVYRTEGDIKRFELKAYIVKAPKLFTSEKPIDDAGLQSRTIVIEMEKNKRKIPLYKLPKYYERALAIRNKLLLWRLRNLNKIDLSEIEYGFPELETFERRVQQVITPIYYFGDEAAKKEIKLMAKQQEDETFRERRESDEGKIFEVIVDMFRQNQPASLGQIASELNRSRRVLLTEKMIGQLVRKVLGFDIKRVGTGEDKKSIVLVEKPSEIEHLYLKASYYGLSITEVSGEHGESGEHDQS